MADFDPAGTGCLEYICFHLEISIAQRTPLGMFSELHSRITRSV